MRNKSGYEREWKGKMSTVRYEVHQKGITCPCCSWETLGVFSSRKEAKKFVGKDKSLVIVREYRDEA